jgi:EAL domain-containing protein (putative c-di-GMP-specific phosphodiesterase class I)
MADQERARQVLSELRHMGIRVAIDDFGTGYSSLAYLKVLPADEVKIDRSFVTDISTDARNAAIVRSIITLSHDLGLQVTAEGVEDAETVHHLREYGCDEAQGYYLSRPLDDEAVPRRVARMRWNPTRWERPSAAA